MLSISNEMKDYLSGSEINLKRFWRIYRNDGLFFGFTDHDEDFLYENILYKKTNSINSSDIVQTSDLSVNNMEITFNINDLPEYSSDDKNMLNETTDELIRVGLYNNSKIVSFFLVPDNLELGEIPGDEGYIGNIITNKYKAIFEFRSSENLLQKNFGRNYTLNCNANFGDSNCKVNKATYTKNDLITKIINKTSFNCNLIDTMSSNRKSISNMTLNGNNLLIININNHQLSTGSFITISSCDRLPFLNGNTIPVTVINSNNIRITIPFTESIPDSGNFGEMTQKLISEYYKNGVLKFTSGKNSTINNTYTIKNYNPNFIELMTRPLYPIEVGDTFEVLAGCDKTPEKCRVYNNFENYYAFPFIPGDDFTFQSYY